MTLRLREAALWTGAVLGLLSVVTGTAVMFFGFTFLIFRSGSMGPDIPTGSLALARTTPVSDLEPGDVVSVVAANGDRITHRLLMSTLRGDEASLVLQGDANGTPDEEIYQVSEVERSIASVPYVGYAVSVLLSPAGLVAAGCLSGMLLLLGFGSGKDRPSEPPATGGGRHRGERASGPRRPRVVVGTVVASVAVVVTAAGVSSTWAFFTDTARVSSAPFTSLDLPAPVLTCTSPNAGTVVISFPAGGFPAQTNFAATLSGGTPLAVSAANNNRTVTITQAQAGPGPQGGILEALFGYSQDYTVTVSASLPVGVWSESATRAIRSSQAGRLGGQTGITCP